jgi:hypothetical protein
VPEENAGTDTVPSLAEPVATLILIVPAPEKLPSVTVRVLSLPVTERTCALAEPVVISDTSLCERVIVDAPE